MEEMTKETPLAPAENDCIIELVDLTRVFEDDGMVAVDNVNLKVKKYSFRHQMRNSCKRRA